MCCEGWSYPYEDLNGECPDCGNHTVDGEAQYGCYYARIVCETCNDRPCEESC